MQRVRHKDPVDQNRIIDTENSSEEVGENLENLDCRNVMTSIMAAKKKPTPGISQQEFRNR